MNKTLVTVHLLNAGQLGDDQTVSISSSLLRKWRFPNGQSAYLEFGAFKSFVRVVGVSNPEQLRLSHSLAARMGLHAGAKLNLTYRPGIQTIHLGPLLGVIVSRAFPDQPEKPFGNITAFCRELTEAARTQGVFVFFFPPNGIGDSISTVEGWTYARGWKKGTFPAPDVLHNRLTTRRLENHSTVQQFFKETKTKYGTHVFNEKYLDKTEVFAALKKEAAVQRYLPESHAYLGFESLRSMAEKYRTVFLKPIRGSLGKGIIRVAKSSAGGFMCHYSELNGTRKVAYPSITKVYAALSSRLRSQKFQIQQGLDIASVGGRPVDFRALVQKGNNGTWEITSIVGRIAGANHFVSNLAKGGTICTMKDAVLRSNIPSGKRSAAVKELKHASLAVAKGIETSIPAHFGELGVDLAVDRSGRVWLLEVNSKPSKNDNTQLTEGKIRPSVKKLIQYVRYVSKK